jgi:hypothetical protein
MTSITICLVYFRSLALANLAASLYSIRRQDLSAVNSLVVLDNNTSDSLRSIQRVIDEFNFPVPVCFSSSKHGDPSKTHAWSTNQAVALAQTSWVFFTRADYLLESSALEQYCTYMRAEPEGWSGVITSYGKNLLVDIAAVEQANWRNTVVFPPVPGNVIDYSEVDTGVWLMPKRVFDSVEGLDERLMAWGHAQTEFQHRLHKSGVTFHCIPRVLYYHPLHGAERDLDLGHRQLAEIGQDLKEMWRRHPGVY